MGAHQVSGCGGEQRGDRIGTGGGQELQVGTQGRPCQLLGEPVE